MTIPGYPATPAASFQLPVSRLEWQLVTGSWRPEGTMMVETIAVVVAFVLLAGAVILFARRRSSRPGARSARARALAARGFDRVEISRRTGLSRDAVAMLLLARSGRRGRRNLPRPARIAGETNMPRSEDPVGGSAQVYAGKQDISSGSRGRATAHRLLDALAQSVRFPRARKAA